MTEPESPVPDGLTPEEIAELRTALIERRKTRRENIVRLTGPARESGEGSSAPIHPANLGTETSETDKDLGLAEKGSDEVAQIDRALDRMAQGLYGLCEVCDRTIGKVRLQAIPYALRCLSCQTDQESHQEVTMDREKKKKPKKTEKPPRKSEPRPEPPTHGDEGGGNLFGGPSPI